METSLPPIAAGALPEVPSNSSEQFIPRAEEVAQPTTPSITTPSDLNPPVIPSTGVDATVINNAAANNSGAVGKKAQKKIEQHYADKTRQAIAKNSDDPNKEALLVGEIKRDYLRDVYHRNVKTPEM